MFVFSCLVITIKLFFCKKNQQGSNQNEKIGQKKSSTHCSTFISHKLCTLDGIRHKKADVVYSETNTCNILYLVFSSSLFQSCQFVLYKPYIVSKMNKNEWKRHSILASHRIFFNSIQKYEKGTTSNMSCVTQFIFCFCAKL